MWRFMFKEFFYPTDMVRYFKWLTIVRVFCLVGVTMFFGLELYCSMLTGYHWHYVIVNLLLILGLVISICISVLDVDNYKDG